MMNKDQFNKLMKSLKRIQSKLDILIRLQRTSMPKPKITPAEREILKLCDRKHTVEDMVKETGKSKTNVETLLSNLRRKAQIVSIRVEGKVVHKRI